MTCLCVCHEPKGRARDTLPEYKTEWRPNELNIEFWNEVLVGRKITALDWDQSGVTAFLLDSGEKVYLTGPGGRFCIKTQS